MTKRMSISLLALALVAAVAIHPGVRAQEGLTKAPGTSGPGDDGSLMSDVATGEVSPVELNTLDPTSFSTLELSATDRQSLAERVLERRERMAALAEARGALESPPHDTTSDPIPSLAGATELSGTVRRSSRAAAEQAIEVAVPIEFQIGRNSRNALATLQSSLAEPVAANEGPFVLFMGNTHQELSLNGGATFANIPILGGPQEAPFACCDPDIVYDQARGTTFRIWLYTNAAQTNGVVRIFVRRRMDQADACVYQIDPGGDRNDVVPDYPHLGITNNHLYLTTNNVRSDDVWLGAQVYRFNIDQMSDCQTTAFSVFTYLGQVGQRVFVPAQGTRETMYWGMHESANVFRVFGWNQAAGGPFSVLRGVAASSFANPDCRGGVGNFDFIERPTAWTIQGFRMRGVVGRGTARFYWHSAPIGGFPQAHVRAAVFRELDLALVAQPHVWNNLFCFGYPAVTANERGDTGLTIAAGGQAGGGGTAAQGYVGIDDDFTPGNTFGTVFLTATGDRNRSDGRFGDYFNTLPHEPCDLWFDATNYSLLGTGVNARYIEFGRARDNKCYTGWRTKIRNP